MVDKKAKNTTGTAVKKETPAAKADTAIPKGNVCIVADSKQKSKGA